MRLEQVDELIVDTYFGKENSLVAEIVRAHSRRFIRHELRLFDRIARQSDKTTIDNSTVEETWRRRRCVVYQPLLASSLDERLLAIVCQVKDFLIANNVKFGKVVVDEILETKVFVV